MSEDVAARRAERVEYIRQQNMSRFRMRQIAAAEVANRQTRDERADLIEQARAGDEYALWRCRQLYTLGYLLHVGIERSTVAVKRSGHANRRG